MITNEDRRWLDTLYRQAVIDVYGPWTANGMLPAREREHAIRRVTACRAELARTQDTIPFPVLVFTGGARV